MQTTQPSSKISVYGGFGFVLGEFCRQFNYETIRIPKHEVVPSTNKILYGISTSSNYNIFDSPTLDVETNLVHLMEVLDAGYKTFGKNFEFTFLSSWFVYGKPEFDMVSSFPMTEESPCNPVGFYSITKRTAEQLLISYCETFGIKYKILRLCNILGAKDHKVSSKQNALQFIIDRIVHNEPIELYDFGEFYRDYMDVRDCARAIRLCLDFDKYKIINVSNGKSSKFVDLVKMAAKLSESTSFVGDQLHRPDPKSIVQAKDIFISNAKLLETGYSPKYTIDQTIGDIILSYKGK